MILNDISIVRQVYKKTEAKFLLRFEILADKISGFLPTASSMKPSEVLQ